MTKDNSRRWPRLVAGFIMLVFAGIIYAWSILKAPLATEFSWDKAQLGLNFTITMGLFCIGGIVGSVLLKRLSAQLVTLIGAALTFLGFFLTSRAQGEIFLLYLSYGFLCGTGIGMVYNVIISTVSSWYLDKRATASGVMMMGFGASSLLLGPVLARLFDSFGWRSAYFVFGVAIFTVLLVGSFFMVPNLAARKAQAASIKHSGDLSPKEMLRTSSFWLFYLFLILVSVVGTGVISFGKDVALSVGAAESLAVLLVGALSVCNGLSRIITGYLFDSIGRVKTMLLSNAVAILAVLLMMAAVYFSSIPFVIAGMLAVGFSYGSGPPIGSGYVSKLYGPTYFATNFSLANTQLIFSSFSSTISGMILGVTGSYLYIFAFFLLCAVLALFINLYIRSKGRQVQSVNSGKA